MPQRKQKPRLFENNQYQVEKLNFTLIVFLKEQKGRKPSQAWQDMVWGWKITHYCIPASSPIWFSVYCLTAHLLGSEERYHCRVSREREWPLCKVNQTRRLGSRDVLFLQISSSSWHAHRPSQGWRQHSLKIYPHFINLFSVWEAELRPCSS